MSQLILPEPFDMPIAVCSPGTPYVDSDRQPSSLCRRCATIQKRIVTGQNRRNTLKVVGAHFSVTAVSMHTFQAASSRFLARIEIFAVSLAGQRQPGVGEDAERLKQGRVCKSSITYAWNVFSAFDHAESPSTPSAIPTAVKTRE